MSQTKKHSNPVRNFEQKTKSFFGNSEIPYKQTKEEVWKKIESSLQVGPVPGTNWFLNHRLKLSVAAALIILLGLFSVTRFYTTTIDSKAGQHLTATLPDGSTVDLNASSTLSYKPFWWKISRTVQFEGEGFFKVQKGDKFTVVSSLASTEVLGTSFNIYARDGQYQVTCHTGKVKVIAENKDEGILSPGYQARLSPEGKVVIYKSPDMKSTISWIDNKFIFTAVPLSRVFEEIQRQYNVKITAPAGLNYSYTGYFTKDKPIENVLELVCKPFGLRFVTKSNHEFVVITNADAR
jgi:transmembrane sensor